MLLTTPCNLKERSERRESCCVLYRCVAWKTELAAAARYQWSKPLQAYTLEPAERASMAGVEARNCSATLPGKLPDSLA